MPFHWLHPVLLSIFYNTFTCGQYAEQLKFQESCVGTTMTMVCPQNYVPIVHRAAHAVNEDSSDCRYNSTDCFQDATDTVICGSQTSNCSIYAVRKPLNECESKLSTYFYVEYTCVPLSIDDPSKMHGICGGGGPLLLAMDHGVLRSPGYPRQFQITPSRCFVVIEALMGQVFRFWLTDLNIGPGSPTCPDDYIELSTMDQTFRHCGRKKFAYPHICSTRVMIAYQATRHSALYRGVQLYFEVINQTSSEPCSTMSSTPFTATSVSSTTISPFVALGIASPLRRIQICAGKRS